MSHKADRWFVSLTVERQIADPVAPIGEAVGIDVGLKNSLTLRTGEVVQGPRALAAGLRKLRREQRAVSRSQRNSGRRKVKVAKVARTHARVTNVRGNWHHGVSDQITRRYRAVGHEGLNLPGLGSKKRHQGRAWADLGIGELFRQIAYKAAWRGIAVVVASRWFASSQWCSHLMLGQYTNHDS